MLDKLYSLFSHDIGMDLGTSNTLVYVKGKGILIREPSVVTMHKKTKQVLAVGEEARKMLGKTPSSLLAIRPLKDGVISDFKAAEKMIEYFIKQIHKIPSRFPKIPKPRMVIGVPSGVTSVERRAVIDVARNAGAREVYLLDEPMAAAIGCGIDVSIPKGNMIVDLGGGTTEIAVISLSGLVVNKSLRIAGDELDMEIVNYAKDRYNLLLGERTAEMIKCTIGSVLDIEGSDPLKTLMRGRDLKTGLPRAVEISSFEIKEALLPAIKIIMGGIKDAIEDTPAELMPDIVSEGIILAGGTSQLRGLDKFLSHELKIPVRVAGDPMTAVVRGCGKVLNDLDLLEKIKIS